MVFDTSAILARIFNEPGRTVVEQLTADHGCAVSPANLLEIEGKLRQRGFPDDAIAAAVEELPAFAPPLTREMAQHGASLDDGPLRGHLSTADRACIGTAIELGAPIVTADRAWSALDLPVDVIQIR